MIGAIAICPVGSSLPDEAEKMTRTRNRQRSRRVPEGSWEAVIEALTHDGRGIARVEGLPVFIPGVLQGERVRFSYTLMRRDFAEAQLEAVLEASPYRVEPRCPHYGICGGCSFQHVRDSDQIVLKGELLLEQFRRLGGLEDFECLPPLESETWGYRQKARLGVKYVAKKGRVLVGFREKAAPYIADLAACPVLDPRVGLELSKIAEVLGELSIRDRIPQIEVAVGDDRVALVFRLLEDLGSQDGDRLLGLGRELGYEILVQREGPESVVPLDPSGPSRLHYEVPDSRVQFSFKPTDFTQVNAGINRKMIQRVLDLLEPLESDRVLDLFCGIGNFTLPLARLAREVVGVEGSSEAVDRAKENAALNSIDQAVFHVADLTRPPGAAEWAEGPYDLLLLDPSRAGAIEILSEIPRWHPRRIVYVSCNPSTLARDAGILVHDHGYQLMRAGVMDMFPQTAHVESIAVFDRRKGA